MKNFKQKLLGAVSAAAFGLTILSASAGTAFAAQKITVATEPAFPPFQFVETKQDHLTGFEVEIMREIAKEAGLELDWKYYSFDATIPAVISHNIDMVASAVTITDERKKRVLFSDPFFQTGLSVIVQNKNADTLKTMDNLAGKTIAVQLGSTSHIAAKNIPGAIIKTYNSAGDAILELANGGADAVINDRTSTAYMLMQQPKFNKILTLQPQKYKAALLGFAFAKDSTELCEKINAALAKIKANGRYDAVYKEWFGNN